MRRFPTVGSHLLLWTAIVLAVPALYDSNTSGQSPIERIWVLGSRPLSDALLELEKRHPWLVTYEDAYYEYQPDLEDYTARVQRVVDPTRPRFFFAPTRPFAFDYEAADVARPQAVLADMVESYYSTYWDYEYQLLQQGRWFHVIPASSRNAKGERIPRRSRLDVRVTIPDAERTVEQTIDEVLAAVSALSSTTIRGPGWRMRLLRQTSVRTGARNEIARDVLMRALDATGRKVRWHLLCDAPPDSPSCVFNLRMIE